MDISHIVTLIYLYILFYLFFRSCCFSFPNFSYHFATVVIYNAIINACAYTIGDISEQRRAMEIAHLMLQDVDKSPYANADQVTYGTFLKVCENQMPPSDTRRQLVNVVFKKCIKDGQMGKLVLEQLKSILTPEQFEEMIGFSMVDHTKGWKDLPLEWRCNVIEGKKRRRTRLH